MFKVGLGDGGVCIAVRGGGGFGGAGGNGVEPCWGGGRNIGGCVAMASVYREQAVWAGSSNEVLTCFTTGIEQLGSRQLFSVPRLPSFLVVAYIRVAEQTTATGWFGK